MAREKFQTLTEQMFYILLCLRREQCGADIMERVPAMTGGRVSVGPGTLYNLLEQFLAGRLHPGDEGGGPEAQLSASPPPGRRHWRRRSGGCGSWRRTMRRITEEGARMSKRKREVGSYLLFDYRGVEAHLTKMAARGWRLEKVGTYFWTYRRAEPARVTYAVTYLPDASQFDPDPSEQQASLAELCAAAGWEKAADWGQMQIFVNERPDPVPLETDEAVRLEVIRRSMKKSFQPWGIAAAGAGGR